MKTENKRKQKRSILLCTVYFVLVLFAQNNFAQVLVHQKISDTQGNFTGTLVNNDEWGHSVTTVGDLDGDGVTDMVVGEKNDGDMPGGGTGTHRGAIWVLFMKKDMTVKSHRKISQAVPDFPEVFTDWSEFGSGVAGCEYDLNSDGIKEKCVAVGVKWYSVLGPAHGAVYILGLSSTGIVTGYKQLACGVNGLPSMPDYSTFGSSVTNLGDMNGDGIHDLGVGAWGDRDGAVNSWDLKGATYVLIMNANGTVQRCKKISLATGGFTGPLRGDWSFFGSAIAPLGDINGDGYKDIAVSARNESPGTVQNFKGTVFVLMLDANQNVIGQTRIGEGPHPNLSDMNHWSQFGSGLAFAGDQNGDGVSDLFVGARNRTGLPSPNCGAVYILYLNTLGRAIGAEMMSIGYGGFNGILNRQDFYGESLSNIGDWDGNGKIDFVAGAVGDNDGLPVSTSRDRGALWMGLIGPDKLCLSTTCTTLSGSVIADYNFSCTKQPTEPSAGGKGIRLVSSTTGLNRYVLTNASGNYVFNVPPGVYTLTIDPARSFTICPGATRTVTVPTGGLANVNFFTQGENDACLPVINAITDDNPGDTCNATGDVWQSPCPGQRWRYCVAFGNGSALGVPGLDVLSGTLRLTFPEGFSVATPLSSNVTMMPSGCDPLGIPTPAVCAGPDATGLYPPILSSTLGGLDNIISWDFCNFPGDGCFSGTMGVINACVMVNISPLFLYTPPTPTPFIVTAEMVNVFCTDGSPALVTPKTFPDEVSCACDPNNLTLKPAGCGEENWMTAQPLTYRVNFQNLGAGPAFNIRVKVFADSDLDPATFVLGGSSHTVTSTNVSTTGVVEFRFDNINLPAEMFYPGKSSGWVEFTLSPRTGLPDPVRIETYAEIKFDSYSDIPTNLATAVFTATPAPIVDLGDDVNVDPHFATTACTQLTGEVYGGNPAYEYRWSTGEITPDITVCPSVTTTYLLAVTDANGDCIGTDEVTVNVIDARCGPGGNKVQICHVPPGHPENARTLCVSPSAATAMLANGSYVGPCIAGHKVNSPFPEFAEGTASLTAQPNPASESTKVTFTAPGTGHATLTLMTLTGTVVKEIWSGEVEQQVENAFEINTRDLAAGIYFLELRGMDYHKAIKLVVVE